MRSFKKVLLGAGVTFSVIMTTVGCSTNVADSQSEEIEVNPSEVGSMVVGAFGEVDSIGNALQYGSSSASLLLQDQNLALVNSGVTLGKQTLAKTKNVTENPATIDFSDSSNGFINVYSYSKGTIKESFDTMVVKWDAFAKDALDGNETIISIRGASHFVSGKIERYSMYDSDGDGVLRGDAVYNIRAKVNGSITWPATRIYEKTDLEIDAGDDHNFDTESDNNVISIGWIRKKSDVVISSASFVDADNDGFIFNRRSTELSLVDVALFETQNNLKPLVDTARLTMRMLTVDGEAVDIVKLGGVEILKSGRVVKLIVVDSTGDSIVTANEYAKVKLESTIDSNADPVRRSTITVGFNVGSGLQNESDNRLYEIHASIEKRHGFVKSREFHFTTSDGFLQGTDPKSGHCSIVVTYFNGKTVSVEADFDENGFSGIYTDPEGVQKTVTWAHDGKVIADSK